MLRKLSLAAVVAASLFASFASVGQAQAGDCHPQPYRCGTSVSYDCSWDDYHCTIYCVYVFDCHCGRWKPFRQCGSLCEAQRLANLLRASGYNCTVQAL